MLIVDKKIDFGKLGIGKHKINFSISSSKDITITDVRGTCGCTSVEVDTPFLLKAGESKVLYFNVNVGKVPWVKRVNIFMDKDFETVELKIS